jgi:hypothetical protein
MINNSLPDLPLEKWIDTYDMLHLLSQIIGKIKLQFVPYKNHWWNVALYPTVNGFSTGIIPYNKDCFEIDFDLYSHKIIFKFNNGKTDFIELRSGTIKSFYEEIENRLRESGCEIKIWPVPVEMDYRVPFNIDDKYYEYNKEYADKFRQVLLEVTKIMDKFRSGFTGKASPIHFFWGSFDMALTFFSGRSAPEHNGAPNVAKEVMVKAYNSELASFGFWPGKGFGEPAFYSYTYPEPEEYKNYNIKPVEAFYYKEMGDFILPYKSLQKYEDHSQAVLDFFKSCFKAAEESGRWDKNLSNY